MCEHGEGHVISCRSTCIDWFPYELVEHSFTINSVIQGNHIYKDGWNAPIGEILNYN